jgi:CRISPR/Cas system CSM-associated protein Csm3 (group 7 of RAMP superfamily)
MAFKNRWRIRGTLITKTPLHVGNGEITTRNELVAEISAVATDYQGRAYIPGTTLKGTLRAWLVMNIVSSSTLNTVFGSADPSATDAVGGKAEFWDAFALGTPDPPPRVPYWDASRLTGVATSVAIDRRTRTASPNKLFHEEFVPAGISFEVTLTGQDLEPEELDLVLFALEGFNDATKPVAIGADTGAGQGRFTWKLNDIAQLTKADVATWLQQQPPAVGYDSFLSLEEADCEALVTRALSTFQRSRHPAITLTLDILFEGPFLVNDPSQAKKDKSNSSIDNSLPDHAPLRNHQGRIVLPARSIRGAFRSQAEKILRTLNAEAACHAVDPEDACAPVYAAEQQATRLCLACQVFGAPGWRARVEFSDFLPVEGEVENCRRQEFLAIDRFTGGGAEGLKFNAAAVYRPTLTGTMSIRLGEQGVEPWALGLLALTLRDLIEGDIPLGFGAAKGYGACKAMITGIQLTGLEAVPALQAILTDSEATQIDFNRLDTTTRPPLEVELVVMELVKAFQKKVEAFQRPVLHTGGENAFP